VIRFSLGRFFLSLLALLMLGTTGSRATTASPLLAPKAIIIDTDMGSDDWMAILYLLRRSDISVKAITIAATGEAHCAAGAHNALALIALSGQHGIPVACGSETPLQGNHAFPADWRKSADALLNMKLLESPALESATELLTSILQGSTQKMTLLALGPLTNLAQAFKATPALADHLDMIYIMGGAIDVPGNIAISGVGISNSVAEWNIYVDPSAANIVLNAGVPITFVPLDATNHVPLTDSFYQSLKGAHTTPEATFIFEQLTKSYDFIQSGGYFFWDPLAAAILTDGTLGTFQSKTVMVTESEGADSGQLKAVDSGIKVCVAVNADKERFEQEFLTTLNSTASGEPVKATVPCAP
jgi:inosine-uridine nucleoside N-ribohydrolase